MGKQNQKEFVKEITDMTQDFPQWYTDVVLKTQLVDYGPVKGTMVIRPYGYGIWECIQRELDNRIKATGHVNAYFPLLIPESLLKKEAEHVEGFAPEVAMVTIAGGEPLSERLVVRPTSETVICDMYSKWINSYRDLPVLINQWANVVRWEKTTRPFLRTSEFLWQEGHTVHATEEEAVKETLDMLGVYKELAEDVLAIPVISGKKSEKEKFAGAVNTYGIEAMMLDGKSLQAGTTHYFGDKFSTAYNIRFLDKDGVHKFAYQTSWGVSTRLIGALIMAHGDQRGLVLPPLVAPVQVVILPIASHKEGVLEKAREIEKQLKAAGIRVKLDDSDQSAGWKFNEYEMKGVPIRLEIGPRDIENNLASLAIRFDQSKHTASLETIALHIKQLLETIQKGMLEKARKFRDGRIVEVKNLDEMQTSLAKGNFVKSYWCGEPCCETVVKEKMQASSRVMPLDEQNIPAESKCAVCGKPASSRIIWAKAY